MNMERFIKIMLLTTSDVDGEALAAIRMANRLLKVSKRTWADVLAPGPTIEIHVPDRSRPSYAASKAEYSAQTGGRYDRDPWQKARQHGEAYGAGTSRFTETGPRATWDKVHEPRSKRSQRRQAAREEFRDPFIQEMLDELSKRKHKMDFLMWLAGVTEWWRGNGYLTRGQYNALRRAYKHRPGPP